MENQLATKAQGAKTAASPASGLLQRACACGQHTSGGECSACEKERQSLQRSTQNSERGTRNSESVPPIVHEVLRSPGQPLDTATRAYFEPRFGQDFSHVRVHTDAQAAESANSVNALAYTVGRDVVFESGQYAPGTSAGNRLIAHELTHVMQQRSGSSGKLHLDSESGSSLEREAQRVAQTIDTPISTARPSLQSAQVSSSLVQRAVRPENVTCRTTGLINPNLTGAQAIAAIEAADTEAIGLCQAAETALTDNLAAARAGNPVDANFATILQEELGLSLANPAHVRLVQQQLNRFTRVRGTLESGFLRYMCRGGTVRLVGCDLAGTCGTDFAFTCPGNRLVVLCQAFWDNPDQRGATIMHEPFHILFDMERHAANALRRADSSCFESFALRVAGRAAFASCVGHTAG